MLKKNNILYRIRRIVWALFLLVICSAVSIYMGIRSTGTYTVFERKLPIYRVNTQEKKVSITIDVSWGDDHTEEILKVLKKYNVKATFFIVGRWSDDNQEMIKSILADGHEIGNHSDMHPDMTNISKNKIVEDISAADSKIQKITGEETKLFRCPSGSYNDDVIGAIEETGHYCIQWDVDSIDWKNEGADIEYKRVINKLKPGSIILFHNTGRYTAENLSKLIPYYEKRGYQFIKVSDLIYKNNFHINYDGEQVKN